MSSLFTNVPLSETISIITDTLFRETDTLRFEDCSFYKIQLKKLLELAVKENYFIFDDQIYDQRDDVAMTSLLGLTLASALSKISLLIAHLSFNKYYIVDT